MTVEATFADRLRTPHSIATAEVSSAWGDLARDSIVLSPLHEEAAAEIEAARQLDFLAASRAIERLRVPGRRADLLGTTINVVADAQGYRDSAAVFVIGVDEQEAENATVLSVIRRLA